MNQEGNELCYVSVNNQYYTYFTSDGVSKHGIKFAHLLDIKAPEVFTNTVTITSPSNPGCPHPPNSHHLSAFGTDSWASLLSHKPVSAFLCLSVLRLIPLPPHTLQLYLSSLNVNLSSFNLITPRLSRVLSLLSPLSSNPSFHLRFNPLCSLLVFTSCFLQVLCFSCNGPGSQ